MILVAIAALYVLGVTFTLGLGLGAELGFENPEYGIVVQAAVLWPIIMPIVLGKLVIYE